MSNPTVCCILLTKDRPEMLKRAVAAFRAQTYPYKQMVVYDNGATDDREKSPDDGVYIHRIWNPTQGRSIGALRNAANHMGENCGDVFAHWDVDDYSHPNRLAEQVALLQASGADLVGYNECLFWDTRWKNTTGPQGGVWLAKRDEAWLYRYPNPRYCLGSSFLYWRKTWERQPFDDVNHGEDERMRLKVKSVGVTAMGWAHPVQGLNIPEPRMICAIHGGNTSHYAPERDRAMWRRAENWDVTCERMMKL